MAFIVKQLSSGLPVVAQEDGPPIVFNTRKEAIDYLVAVGEKPMDYQVFTNPSEKPESQTANAFLNAIAPYSANYSAETDNPSVLGRIGAVGKDVFSLPVRAEATMAQKVMTGFRDETPGDVLLGVRQGEPIPGTMERGSEFRSPVNGFLQLATLPFSEFQALNPRNIQALGKVGQALGKGYDAMQTATTTWHTPAMQKLMANGKWYGPALSGSLTGLKNAALAGGASATLGTEGKSDSNVGAEALTMGLLSGIPASILGYGRAGLQKRLSSEFMPAAAAEGKMTKLAEPDYGTQPTPPYLFEDAAGPGEREAFEQAQKVWSAQQAENYKRNLVQAEEIGPETAGALRREQRAKALEQAGEFMGMADINTPWGLSSLIKSGKLKELGQMKTKATWGDVGAAAETLKTAPAKNVGQLEATVRDIFGKNLPENLKAKGMKQVDQITASPSISDIRKLSKRIDDVSPGEGMAFQQKLAEYSDDPRILWPIGLEAEANAIKGPGIDFSLKGLKHLGLGAAKTVLGTAAWPGRNFANQGIVSTIGPPDEDEEVSPPLLPLH